MSDDRMSKIETKKLTKTEIEFMKFVEQQNLDRVLKLKALRKRNLITLGILGAGVFSIYGYSMYAVQQESFLDDFEEPQKSTN